MQHKQAVPKSTTTIKDKDNAHFIASSIFSLPVTGIICANVKYHTKPMQNIIILIIILILPDVVITLMAAGSVRY